MRSSDGNERHDFLDWPGVRTLTKERKTDCRRGEHFACTAETIDPVADHPCAQDRWRVHERRPFTVADTPRDDIGVRIQFRRRWYKCLDCPGALFGETIPNIVSGKKMTERLYRRIPFRGKGRNFSEISKDIAISDTNARSVFRAVAERQVVGPLVAPRVLGLDNKDLLGSTRAVICDITGKRVLAIAEDQTDKCYEMLAAMLNREDVEVITIDMATNFLNMADDLFRQAFVVIDKFHVLKRATKALLEYRLALIRRRGIGSKSAKQKLYKSVRILTKRWHRLKPHQMERLQTLFAMWPEIEVAYHVKEDMYAFYTADSRHEAEYMYEHWKSEIPPSCRPWFEQFAFIRPFWWEYVFNYFDQPYTNAFVESMNRKLDDIHREGRRLSLDMIRWKIMLDPDRVELPEARPKLLVGTTFEERMPNGPTLIIQIGPRRRRILTGIRFEKAIPFPVFTQAIGRGSRVAAAA